MSRMIKTSEGWKKTSGNSDQAELDSIKQSLNNLFSSSGDTSFTLSSFTRSSHNWCKRVGDYILISIRCSPSSQVAQNSVIGTIPVPSGFSGTSITVADIGTTKVLGIDVATDGTATLRGGSVGASSWINGQAFVKI